MKAPHEVQLEQPASPGRRALLRAAGLFGAVAALPSSLFAQAPLTEKDMADVLKTSLKPTHPRVHLDDEGWRALRANVKSGDLKDQYEALQRIGEKLLTAPVAQYKLVGPRLLYESRKALTTISTLAGLYRLSGDRRYADRAIVELRAICAFPSWHPPHFLDVAEMTNAAGLGYDWLYDVLSSEDRQLIRDKIIEYGLRPGLKEYESNVGWSRPFANNWGQVCAGGLTVGALAIAGDAGAGQGMPPPEPADILHWTISKVPNNMLNYAPDGGWPEGPVYWAYATHYTCSMISALNSCLSRDFGLSALPGFAETGNFRVASIGPSGLFFNYADGGANVDPAPEMIWLGNRFHQPLYVSRERELVARTHPSIFHLVWSAPAKEREPAGNPALDIHFTKIDVAFLRSSWTDPNAFFLGIKGGNNAGSHAHLDLGSFVFDALGERWALDLGPDNYDLPEYFGKLRWTYYRMRSEGHNTLTLGGTNNQVLTATAALNAFSTTPQAGSASITLDAAYAPELRHVRRTATLERTAKPALVMVDRIEGDSPTALRWNMHTEADIQISGPEAILTRKGKKLRVTLESPAGAVFTSIPAAAPAPQAQQPQVHVLVADCKFTGQPLEIRVTFREA